MISKKGKEINSIDDWFELAPPKDKKKQWVDGRSAKETAKCWLDQKNPTIPEEINSLVESIEGFSTIKSWLAEPEFESDFDDYRGPANIDVMIFAEDKYGKLLIGVESKADESFSDTLNRAYQKAEIRLQKSSASKGVIRIEQLVKSFLNKNWQDLNEEEKNLRYQLFTGIAGTLAEAERNKIRRAVFIVHEFITEKTNIKKRKQNQNDLNRFTKQLTKNRVKELKSGDVVGPKKLERKPSICEISELYIGKVTRATI